MKNSNEIIIIGPSEGKLGYDVNKLEGKTTFNFSGDLMWFHDNNIYPTYWTFLDPNSTMYIFDRFKSGKYNQEWLEGLRQNTTLIYNDFQGTDRFYNEGLTTSRGQVWNREEFGNKLLPQLATFFKDTISLPSVILRNNLDSFFDERKHLCPMVKHEKGINNDKFSCFILPMVLSYFEQLELIHAIGFGDFTKPRLYNGLSLGYSGYKLSYQRMKEDLLKVLKHKNVNVTFENKDSYFNELTWKK